MEPIVRCSSCGQANRVPAVGSGKKAICGKCKAPLDEVLDRRPVTLTDATFGQTTARGAFVVDFWAAWCGPCRTIGPVVDALAAERTDIRFGKLNVDENPRTAASFRVQGIPLLVFLRDGRETGRLTGAVPKGQIEAAITRYLES